MHMTVVLIFITVLQPHDISYVEAHTKFLTIHMSLPFLKSFNILYESDFEKINKQYKVTSFHFKYFTIDINLLPAKRLCWI